MSRVFTYFLACSLDDSSDFPNTELTDPEDDQAISKLIRYLQKHGQKRHLLREEGNQKRMYRESDGET